MKMPSKCTTEQREDFTNDFFAVARKMSVEYGVFIHVVGQYKDQIQEMAFLERIYYKVKIGGVYHEFDGSAQLVAALKKAIEKKEQV